MNNPSIAQVAASYVLLFLFYVTLVMIGWNAGLVGAGIASDGINWGTAAGLTVCVMLLRGVAHAAASTTINVTKP